MKLLDFLDPSAICIELKSPAKKEALNELCQLLKTGSKITDPEAVVEALMNREKLGSTGIGQGVAIPHSKAPATEKLVAALGVSRRGVDFEALDGEPVHVIFMLVSPPNGGPDHLKALARVSGLLKDKFFRQALKDAKSVEDVLKVIREEDEF
jgi:fructose-specific phosphotransferase system IIA component